MGGNVKKLLIFSLIFNFLILTSCSINGNSASENQSNSEKNDNSTNYLKQNFLPNKNSNFEVVFFDTDNSIVEDGNNFSNFISDLSISNNCSDCYLIKSGTIEILVDCGGQLNAGTEENRLKNFCNNIYKKIVTYCDDGVLDYLIVTHADFDHIKNLTLDGGLFDSLLNNDEWINNVYKKYTNDKCIKNVFGEEAIPITTIKNIIDFDSFRVRHDSTNTAKSNLLLSTELYHKYQTKRDKLIKKCNTIYCPVSYFFSDVTGDTVNSSYHNYYAMPNDYYVNRLSDKGFEQNFKTYLGNVKSTIDKKNYNAPILNGLNLVSNTNGKRYTYDIELENDTKIRFLYNWYYDSYYNTSNGYGQWADNRPGQPQNNICVCFMVESKENKLLILGDLGTYGEDGLLRYYEGTDVLSNVNCFKSSHHGSTTLRPIAENSNCSRSENSKKLFDTICGNEKLNLIITGVAQPSRAFFEENGIISSNNALYSSLSGVAVIDKKLFENIGNHNVDTYCTQIVKSDDSKKFYNQPFYGDIHVIFGSIVEVKYSYCGYIKTYIKRDSIEDNPFYEFKTNYNPIENLEWANKIELI